MVQYIVRRFVLAVPLLILISLISYLVIELPPGDYLVQYIASIENTTGQRPTEDEIAQLRALYGLDKPLYMRYIRWIWNIMRGDLGRSFQHNRPVGELLAERVPLTILITLISILFSWCISVPIGIFSAVRQYSIFDYLFTFLGFIGLATPSFLLALVVMWIAFSKFNFSASGLFSSDFIDAPWSWARLLDLLKHLPVPALILGIGGTAWLIRIMRGNLLDELRKPYVTTARAKGLTETRLLAKYPVRVAINPLISTIGWILPDLFSGSTLVSIVLNLQTVGPVLYNALLSQDMYVAGSIVLILSALTVAGTLISDILLAWVDPRIRYSAGGL
jgi:peptide/nickel transport system permease protein